ncbi:MAG: hypothetical protein DME50_10195 [Verrucomicrobia bacterium]|nr:MAG: hypothetical protein DME85_11380 [Verrucomicrobiota bacterium]PYK65060.1 MAG: hypothetical protein DME50_10195 [Verrucomicrobiota bacterium]
MEIQKVSAQLQLSKPARSSRIGKAAQAKLAATPVTLPWIRVSGQIFVADANREEIGRFISVVKNPIRFCRIRICDRHWPETGPGMIGRSAWPNIDEPVANC